MWTNYRRMIVSLPDVNIWIALAAEGHVHHVPARDWFAAQPGRFRRLLPNNPNGPASSVDEFQC